MSFVISFNGHDNVGKTTQVNRFVERNAGLVSVVSDLSAYDTFPKLCGKDLFDWWFHDSNIIGFVETIYQCVASQLIDAKSYSAPFIIVDKGIPTIDARVLATLQVRGLSLDSAKFLVDDVKSKYNISSAYTELFLFSKLSLEDQVDAALRRSDEHHGVAAERLYARYELFQNKILANMVSNGHFSLVDADGSIPEVSENVSNAIFQEIKKSVPKVHARIIGLSGMSESGKSHAGKYLCDRHGVWNFKLNYFVDRVVEKYHLPSRTCVIDADNQLTAVLVAQEVAAFLKPHYYQGIVSVESLHSDSFTDGLRNVFVGMFDSCFVDTPLDLRISRTAFRDSESLDIVTNNVLVKDELKRSRGTERIMSNAEHVVSNAGNLLSFHHSLDSLIVPKWFYDGQLFNLDLANIPESYKNVLRNVTRGLSNTFNDSLIFLAVGGSCGREDIYPGWSDIDLIIGLEHYAAAEMQNISSIIKGQNIKVGTTVYSRHELECGFVDSKTAATIYYMQQGKGTPIIYDHNLLIPKFSREEIVRRDSILLAENIHSLRRQLYNAEYFDVQKVLRLSTQIIKMALFIQGIDVSGYIQACNMFSEHFGAENFNPTPFLKGKGENKQLYDHATKIIEYIT